MAILFCFAPRTSGENHRARPWWFLVPAPQGQQCALPTQGGVGRAAHGAAPRAWALHKAHLAAKQEVFAIPNPIGLSSKVYGVRLPAIPPL